MIQTKQDIMKQTITVMQELFEIESSKLQPKARLYEDLDIDSIDAVDLLIELKRITNKEINPDQFKESKTLEDIVDVIASL